MRGVRRFKGQKWESGLDNGPRPPARRSETAEDSIRAGRLGVVAGSA
jgi:hypothetical protein